ncbi:hypothetical protein BGI34_00830 [Snodgrassella alvi]|nr:hypothetical protein BGI34_00830 [Snodgrassella alvi]
MITINSIFNLIQDNLTPIGLIIISPAIYRLTYSFTLFIASHLIHIKKDIIIEHYHNGSLVSVTTIKSDINDAIEVNKIENKKDENNE